MKNLLFIILFWLFCIGYGQVSNQVFYSSFRPQGWDIHISKDNGQTFNPFTSHSSLDYDAKISPDGNWVVFTSERLGKPQLFVKHTVGDTLPRLLVKSNSMQDQVDFSPDGHWIAFVSSHEGNAEIYKLPFKPLDTLLVKDAQNLTNHAGGDFRPRFSHDGNSIAFSSDRSHEIKPHEFFVFAMQRTGDIYTMSSNGDSLKRLTNSDAWDGSPNWNTNDSKIIFYSNRFGQTGLYQIDSNGENETQITPEKVNAMSPLVKDDESILFTNENKKSGTFSILELNPSSNTIDSTLVRDIHMLNVDYHNSGIITFHGGKKLKETEGNKGEFSGDILVKNHPAIDSLEDKTVSLFGIRRSFTAPPVLNDTKVVFAYNPAKGFGDFVTPFLYPLIILPLLALIWFVIGIFRSIKKRREIAFWKHIIFSIVSVLILVFILIGLNISVGALTLPMNTVSLYSAIALFVLITFLVIFYKRYKKRKSENKTIASVHKLYAMMLLGYTFGLLYITLCVGSF